MHKPNYGTTLGNETHLNDSYQMEGIEIQKEKRKEKKRKEKV